VASPGPNDRAAQLGYLCKCDSSALRTAVVWAFWAEIGYIRRYNGGGARSPLPCDPFSRKFTI